MNKTLKLRHHKHTGKVLAHKHTSYRVLFVLLLLPIIAVPLVDGMRAHADQVLSVTATIPAPIPPGYPTIDAPASGETTASDTVTVSGTCPVISPAIIIAVYRNLLLAGSAQCDAGGEYSVPISLENGENTLVATVVTITNGIGNSSDEVIINKLVPLSPESPVNPVGPGQSSIEGFDPLAAPLQILAKDIYMLVGVDGKGVWRGSFAGGTPPYEVAFSWGDGVIDHRTVMDGSEQEFAHDYEIVQPRVLVISVTDASGATATLRSTAVAPDIKHAGLVIDKKAGETGVSPIVEFVQKNAAAIYVSTVSALVFLWYIESGRHVLSIGQMMAHIFHFPTHKP